jgi:hypothetical protein
VQGTPKLNTLTTRSGALFLEDDGNSADHKIPRPITMFM